MTRLRRTSDDALLITFSVPYYLGSAACIVRVLGAIRRAGVVGRSRPTAVESGMHGRSDDELSVAIEAQAARAFEIDAEFSRSTGIATLTFAADAATVVLDYDEYLLRPVGSEWLWANAIAIHVAASRDPAPLIQSLPTIAEDLGASFAYMMTAEEWRARHSVGDGKSIRPVGLDVASALLPLGLVTYVGGHASKLIAAALPIQGLRHVPCDHGSAIVSDGAPYGWQERQASLDRLGDQIATTMVAAGRPPIAVELLGIALPRRGDAPPFASRSC